MSITILVASRTHNVSPGDVPAYLGHLGLSDVLPVGTPRCVEAGLMLGEQTWMLIHPTVENLEYALYFIWDENLEANTRVMRWVNRWANVLGGMVMAPRWTDVSTTCIIRGYDPAKLKQWLYEWQIENWDDTRVDRLVRDFVS